MRFVSIYYNYIAAMINDDYICVDLDGHTAYRYKDCALSIYLILSHKHLRNLMLRLDANIICIIL